jgi:hypothetical protein
MGEELGPKWEKTNVGVRYIASGNQTDARETVNFIARCLVIK